MASGNESKIPHWAGTGLAAVVAVLVGVVWTSLAGELEEKADKSEVEHVDAKVSAVKDSLDYLERKAEADLVNDAINRRILNELAAKQGIRSGGRLVTPRPPPHTGG